MEHVITSQTEISTGRAKITRSWDNAPRRSGPDVNAVGEAVRIRTGLITKFLAAIAVVLVIASISVSVAGHLTGNESKVIEKVAKVVSIDLERNVPAFFSMLILLFASVLLGVIASFKHQQNAEYKWHWAVLAVGFFYMAFDEIGEIHEKLIEPMRGVLGGENLGVFYFAWVVPAIAVVGVLGFIFLRFWWNLPKRFRLLILIAGALYLGGAVGVELLNGKYAETYGKENLAYQMLSVIEESLEMAGVITFIHALWDYLAANYSKIELRLFPGSEMTAASENP